MAKMQKLFSSQKVVFKDNRIWEFREIKFLEMFNWRLVLIVR